MEYAACLYASKPCANPRSLKDNGELHRLCTFHRTKANDAQRRWHSRQRCEANATDSDSSSSAPYPKRRPSSPSSDSDSSLPRRRRRSAKLAQPRIAAIAQANLWMADATMMGLPLPEIHFPETAIELCDPLNDEDFALLSEMIGELEDYTPTGEIQIQTLDPFSTFESEWRNATALLPEAFTYSF